MYVVMSSRPGDHGNGDDQFGQTGAETDDPVTGRSEEIHIRNFDVSQSYHLTVSVSDGERTVLRNRYHLPPGKTESVLGRLPASEYEVRVTLDGLRQQTIRCAIDGTPRGTALIEVGNGTLSVSEGLYC